MKTIVVLLNVFLISIAAAFAQDEPETELERAGDKVEENVDRALEFADRNFEFGARIGANISTFNDDQVFNADSKAGLHLGIYTRFLFTQRLSGKIELLYSMQGARADEFAVFKDFSVNLNYLSLPILAELNLGDKITLELGPYIAVLVSSNQSFSELIPAADDEVALSQDETNFVDVGFAGGAIYRLGNGIGLGIRYNQGFADALGNDYFQGASGANSFFQIAVTYTLR